MPQSVYAVAPKNLAVPVFSQHLAIPDSNGDTGYYDCAIAASAMVLQAISGEVGLDASIFSYGSVRSKVRAVFPNIQEGITLRETASIIPLLTNNKIRASFVAIDKSSWKHEVRRHIAAGFPLIVHMSDWSYLEGHGGKGKSAHAIVVSGIDDETISYVDPWDGKEHTIPHTAFATAWSKGHYNWHALVFVENKKATNFSEVMRHHLAWGNSNL